MPAKAPGSLPNSRSIALQKGTVPAGFAEPIMVGFESSPYRDDAVNMPTSNVKPPPGPSPFGT